ncbi:MAG: efflux RND transporter periplasmic adaptor subunit [Candidatus Pelagadaptatus aseana]|uniref:efflux RND transporter periplasmic adaptor subunit n=1 Tax=Candidatus Pelagadaptatus aseana TaxID=3120508 RepID=UPI0039B198A6
MKNYLQTFWSNTNYRKALYILVLISAWLVSGTLRSDPDALPDAEGQNNKTFVVKARYIEAQNFQPAVKVRAQTEADRSVSLKAEISGRVVSLPVTEGQVVKTGDTICELAVEDRALRLEEARSAVAQAQLEYDGALKLKQGYQSRNAIAAAKARLDSRKADLKRSELNLANTRVKAPFSGVVERHSVDVGDFMDRGAECGVILDLNPLIVTGEVSEKEVVNMRVGQKALASFAGGHQVDAELRLVSFESSPVTRTYRVEAAIDNASLALRSGLTSDLMVSLDNVQAHLIPASLLSLDDYGDIGVRILDENNVVQFVRLTIIGDRDEGVWVLGLSQRSLLITVGQEYAIIGSTVGVEIETAETGVAGKTAGVN